MTVPTTLCGKLQYTVVLDLATVTDTIHDAFGNNYFRDTSRQPLTWDLWSQCHLKLPAVTEFVLISELSPM